MGKSNDRGVIMEQVMNTGRRHRAFRLFLCWLMVFGLCWSRGYVSAEERSSTATGETSVSNGLTVDPDSKNISIDYKDASLVSVLKALSYSFDLNLVMAKDVQGNVSANLQNITIDEVLTAILSVNGFRHVRKNNVIYVMRDKDVETAVEAFHLSFLMASDAKELLSKTISAKGDIQINEATNSLVVVDVSENIAKVKRILAEVDVAPIQVLIEAKIVDIQSKDFENIGTTLNATYDPKGSLGGGLFGRDSSADESLGLATDLAGPSTDVTGNQINLTPTFKSLSVDVQVDALIQKNRAHVLASPSIATLNGKEAKIIIGERFPYVETTQTANGNTQSTKFIDVGTTLKVTPMVSPDGWITMKVHPEVSSVSASLSAGPRITTREADATIRVRDNETIIIGGLINKKDDRVKAGVPFLRSIPVIGWLFSKRSSTVEDTELTVFITPRIIRASSDSLRKTKGPAEPDYANKGDKFIQERMFAYVDNLESEVDKTKPQDADLFKYSEIVQAYQMIYRQFPDSAQADYCLYKIARIYADVFHKSDAAEQALKELLAKFPNSSYRGEAEVMLNAKNR